MRTSREAAATSLLYTRFELVNNEFAEKKKIEGTHGIHQLAKISSGCVDSGHPAISGGITTDGNNLFVVNSGLNRISKVALDTGIVTTLVGSVNQGSTDGSGGTARFSRPLGITTDGKSLFVTDSGNNTIRKIN